jgi:hypothetical protein
MGKGLNGLDGIPIKRPVKVKENGKESVLPAKRFEFFEDSLPLWLEAAKNQHNS